jgi:hypothetical protein
LAVVSPENVNAVFGIWLRHAETRDHLLAKLKQTPWFDRLRRVSPIEEVIFENNL